MRAAPAYIVVVTSKSFHPPLVSWVHPATPRLEGPSVGKLPNDVVPGTLVPGLVALSFTSVQQKTKKSGQSPDMFPGSHGTDHHAIFA